MSLELNLNEDEIYIGAKTLLKQRGWTLLAGQPPDGCNHLPVVEIKSPDSRRLGSGGSYKPDLIASRLGAFLIVECKPSYNDSDVAKIRGILADPLRVSLLFRELQQRHLLERNGIHLTEREFGAGLFGAIAHGEPGKAISDLLVILVKKPYVRSAFLPPLTCPEFITRAISLVE